MKRATALGCYIALAEWISIHALVKRATADFPQFVLRCHISIHALVKRATLYSGIVFCE